MDYSFCWSLSLLATKAAIFPSLSKGNEFGSRQERFVGRGGQGNGHGKQFLFHILGDSPISLVIWFPELRVLTQASTCGCPTQLGNRAAHPDLLYPFAQKEASPLQKLAVSASVRSLFVLFILLQGKQKIALKTTQDFMICTRMER